MTFLDTIFFLKKMTNIDCVVATVRHLIDTDLAAREGNGHMKMCINMYCFLITVFISGCNAIINYYNEYLHRKGTNLSRRHTCSKSS